MILKIGTRKSKLAIVQANLVKTALQNNFSDICCEIVLFTTKGDRLSDMPLSEFGEKGIFAGEIEDALSSGLIDIAVHSAKDLPVRLACGMEISGVLKRADPRDMLIAANGVSTDPDSALNIGTGSIRRRESLKRLYPNAVFSDIRGNVDTRLARLRLGEYDAVVLAAAGIDRLCADLSGLKSVYFEIKDIIPAACQGIIAAECKKDTIASELIRKISDRDAWLCFETERTALKILGGDCSLPTAAYSRINGKQIELFLSLGAGRTVSGTADIDERYELVKRLADSL